MDHLPQIIRALGTVEGHIQGIQRLLEEMKETMDDLDRRIRRVEYQTMIWKGGLGALMLACSVLSVVIPFFF